MPTVLGLHHVTAIAGDPQRNLDFYAGVLGLRLVKRTVNFDDPGTYHFYFGDERGTPGSLLTFFPWPLAVRGRPGTGQVRTTAFAVPAGSLGWWRRRLEGAGVAVAEPSRRFGEELLGCLDPDGLRLELVADEAAAPGRTGGPVSAERAVRGVHSVALAVPGFEATAEVLALLGFRLVAEDGNRFRHRAGAAGTGATVDVVCAPEAASGRIAAGSVHHVAFRVEDEATQREWRRRLAERHLDVTPVLDRTYFRSIYFREPGGVLFELATDGPGFAVDEPANALGESLRLPSWLEERRGEIEAALPPLRPPAVPGS